VTAVPPRVVKSVNACILRGGSESAAFETASSPPGMRSGLKAAAAGRRCRRRVLRSAPRWASLITLPDYIDIIFRAAA